MTQEEITKALETCNAASTGPWQGMPRRPGETELDWIKASDMIHNNRGPDYAVQVLSDEDYDKKQADIAFICLARELLPKMLTEMLVNP